MGQSVGSMTALGGTGAVCAGSIAADAGIDEAVFLRLGVIVERQAHVGDSPRILSRKRCGSVHLRCAGVGLPTSARGVLVV
jgi:hypothetical protein